MGIDLKAGGRRKGHNVRKAPVTKNVYVKLLEKLYSFLSRRGESKFASTIVFIKYDSCH
jgi:large subunit ribosomal protein L18e